MNELLGFGDADALSERVEDARKEHHSEASLLLCSRPTTSVIQTTPLEVVG